MNDIAFQPPPPPPPEPKKKTGLAIGIVIAAVVILCLLVIGGGVAYVLTHPGLLMQLQGTKYTSPDGIINLYHPKDWVLDDSYEGEVILAPTQDVLDQGLTSGAGFLVMYAARDDEQMPADVDPNSPEEFLNYFMEQNFSDITVIEAVKAIKVSGFPAASTVFSVEDTFSGVIIHARMSIAVSPNTYYIILYAAPSDIWDQYAPTLSNIQSTLKLIEQ
jgi:hypothetical protein